MATNRRTPEQRLADLQEQEAQLKARIQKERAKVSERNRKADTRRKIVAGALILEHAEKNPDSETARTLARLLHEYAPNNARHLFDLEPLPEHQTESPPPSSA